MTFADHGIGALVPLAVFGHVVALKQLAIARRGRSGARWDGATSS